MSTQPAPLANQVVMITGAAQRVGAVIAKQLHALGANIVIHYRSSRSAAETLADELTANRQDSVELVQADLADVNNFSSLVSAVTRKWKRLDALVNNASSFYPTPVGEITETQWDDLITSNVKGPLFLSQALAPMLKQQQGCIINIADIHAQRPLKNHSVYCIAKAGLVMLTKSLALELGPKIRVNAVAPGAIIWPSSVNAENQLDQLTQDKIISRTFLKTKGQPEDIAKAVTFFIKDAPYVTGQILAVDGGRSQSN